MAKSVISGLTVAIGADTKKFKEAIGEIDKQARNLAKDLKLVSQSLKIDPGDAESYADKMKLLQDAVSNSSNKINVINQAIKKLSDELANGKITQTEYESGLKDLNRQLESANREYNLAVNALDEYQRETSEAAKDVDKLGDETKETAQETTELGNAIAKKLLTDAVKKGFEKLVDLAKSLARHIAEAAKELVKFSGEAINMAASYEDALGYADTIFGKQVSENVKYWVDANSNALRIYKGDLLQNVNTYGQLFQTMGLDAEESFGMATNIMSLAADLRAATGKDIVDINTALTAGFTNTTRALRQFGVRISEAEIKAYALDNGIVQVAIDQTALADKTLKVREAAQKAEDALDKYGEESLEYERAQVNVQKAEADLNKLLEGKVDSLTAAERTMAIYLMMLEQLAPIIGQNTKESGLFSSQLNELKTKFQNLKLEIGKELLPVATDLLTRFNSFLDSEKGKELLDSIVKAFGDLADEIVRIAENGKINEMVDHFIESAPELVKQLGDIVTDVIELAPKLGEIADGVLGIMDAVNKYTETGAWLKAEKQVEDFAKAYGVSTEQMELMVSEFARENQISLTDVYNNWATYEPWIADYIDKIPEHTGNMAEDIRLHLDNAAKDAEDFAKNRIPSIDTTNWQRFWYGLKAAVQDVWDFLTTFFSSDAWEKATTDAEGGKWDFGSNFANFGAPHAMGGTALAGHVYRVNDDAGHRPEMFIPNMNGYILNGNQVDRITNNLNNSRNFSGGIQIYVNSYGTNVAEVADELGAAFSQRIRMSGAMP